MQWDACELAQSTTFLDLSWLIRAMPTLS